MTRQALDDRVRAFSALYPIPIVFSAMLVFALSCFGLAAIIPDSLRWLWVAIGSMVALIANALVVYVVVCKSDLLRVERETITIRWIDRI